MAITKIDWPTASTASDTPSISTDYNAQNENLEELAKTTSEINLTNWDTGTTAPAVEAGSAIECLGSIYQVTSAETISTTGASSGTVYLVFDATAEEFQWTSTAPSWSSTYRGYYVGDDRFTGHECTWNGSTSFSDKLRWIHDQRDADEAKYGPGIFKVDGTLDVGDLTSSSWTGTYGTQSVSASGGTWVIPAGFYMMFSSAIGNNHGLQIYSGSSWLPSSGAIANVNGVVVSDGTNYRIYNNSASAITIYYRKI